MKYATASSVRLFADKEAFMDSTIAAGATLSKLKALLWGAVWKFLLT
jgi:hypothetical protein